jgi:hypothetical protein
MIDGYKYGIALDTGTPFQNALVVGVSITSNMKFWSAFSIHLTGLG